MSKQSLSEVHWETVLSFSWGVKSKLTYKTREEARKGRKTSIENHTNQTTGKVYDYIVDISIYKVTHLAGLSSLSGNGVYIYQKSR